MCNYIVFGASDKRPRCFYKLGFAHKVSIEYRQNFTSITVFVIMFHSVSQVTANGKQSETPQGFNSSKNILCSAVLSHSCLLMAHSTKTTVTFILGLTLEGLFLF